jgi:hypothetical protein
VSVEDQFNGSTPAAPAGKAGRHRIQTGTPMPGFDRVGATRTDYTVKAILARNGRQVPGEDEAGAR